MGTRVSYHIEYDDSFFICHYFEEGEAVFYPRIGEIVRIGNQINKRDNIVTSIVISLSNSRDSKEIFVNMKNNYKHTGM